MKLFTLCAAVSLAAGTMLAAGCGHNRQGSAAPGTAASPTLTPQQEIQQIQNDPNQSPETKAFRLKSAQERLGPDPANYSHSPAPASHP